MDRNSENIRVGMDYGFDEEDALANLVFRRIFDCKLFKFMVKTVQLSTFCVVALDNELWSLSQKWSGYEIIFWKKITEIVVKLFRGMNDEWK